ncbi:hypothetical protein ABT282_08600 [Streptomyces sp. NPDC000927]|uniref:hypothetical protein n=1 Tax=Streptomyces sp. NPDC000927 TaxID=3154371 RepID=UPI00332EDA56
MIILPDVTQVIPLQNGYNTLSAHLLNNQHRRQATGDWRPAPPRQPLEPSSATPGQIQEAFAAAFASVPNLTERSETTRPNLREAADDKGETKTVKTASGTYDISTIEKARTALTKVKSDGSPMDQAKVRSAVEKAYPDLKSGDSDNKSGKSNPFAGERDSSKPSMEK